MDHNRDINNPNNDQYNARIENHKKQIRDNQN